MRGFIPKQPLVLGIACDIGFENRLALENTRLLLTYATIDPARIRTLVLFRELACNESWEFWLMEFDACSQGVEQEAEDQLSLPGYIVFM